MVVEVAAVVALVEEETEVAMVAVVMAVATAAVATAVVATERSQLQVAPRWGSQQQSSPSPAT